MGKILVLCGIFLCLSLTATANDSNVAPDASSGASAPAAPMPAAPAPVSLYPPDRSAWQVGAGFQYQHFQPFQLNFHNLGYHADVTRYFSDWLGVEAAVQTGFGHTNTIPSVPRSLDAKSLFVGAGPHVSVTNRPRFEPWVHVLVGLEHFRFTQTDNTIGIGGNTGLGFMAGGGVDFKVIGSAAWRVQGDYIGTRFQSAFQTNYSVGTGIVFNF